MNPDPNNPKRRPLVTVGEHRETDIATGETERQLFVKMYFEARDSGLLAAIPDKLWKMLCVLATYIDENGNCYPSQSRIAKDLGVHRQRVNERIKELLDFRFDGRPVISVAKNRVKRDSGGMKWANNVYRLYPITGLRIFNREEDRKAKLTKEDPCVRKSGHELVSSNPDTRNPDTNQTQDFNKNVNVNGLIKTRGEDPEASGTKAEALVLDILDVTRDPHSTGFYRRVAHAVPEHLVFRALSETKDQAARGRIRKSRGAFFTDTIDRLAREHGYDLGLASEESSDVGDQRA